ncbi:MAG: MSMEG_0567/Sll0786 family nitrogen starvation N-acetyltransferase [Microbacteriaceae bacterium]
MSAAAAMDASKTEDDVQVAGVAGVVCRSATTAEDFEQHYAVRHRVFVEEQKLFTDSDHDARDTQADTIHVVGYADSVPAGAVRLFPLDPAAGLWQGDRLAVLSDFRAHGLGAPLVRYAVATAGGRGGSRMLAHVQVANVAFFIHLGWSPVGDVESYIGQPHQRMLIELSRH